MTTRLDIISDPICPWCLIGRARLMAALAQRPGYAFDIRWHPFQLNPDMPASGMDRRAYLEAKFGGREGALRAYAPVVQAAQDAGLDVDLSAATRTPNTLDAHRLIHWAEAEGAQDAVVARLFERYFKAGDDISDPEVLADIAAQCGMDREVVARLLAGEADRADIAARDANLRARGVTGVPTFVIGNAHALVGAQPADVWVQIIDELAAAAQPKPAADQPPA